MGAAAACACAWCVTVGIANSKWRAEKEQAAGVAAALTAGSGQAPDSAAVRAQLLAQGALI